MKKLLLLLTLILSVTAYSQILEPVKWDFESRKTGDQEYVLTFIANIDEHWAVYSQYIDDGGPIPTEFFFEQTEAFTLIDSVIESEENRVTKHDPVFDMVLSKFYDKAIFKQKVKIIGDEVTIKGGLMFMTCDDEKCLAPTDVPFEFQLSSSGASSGQETKTDNIAVNDEETNNILYGLSPDDITRSSLECENEYANLAGGVKSEKSLWNIFVLGFFLRSK